jgi:hypothetical protein
MVLVACVSTPNAGSLGEGSAKAPKIVGVDTAVPPRSASVQLEEPAWAALLLVAPGHSATLLYPPDSQTSNRLTAGATTLQFRIPDALVPSDSTVLIRRGREVRDTTLRTTRRPIPRDSERPIDPESPSYLLLVTSPQRLDFARIREKTTGVSLPVVESEALNAVGKTIKSTIVDEPRTWAGFYHRVDLFRR